MELNYQISVGALIIFMNVTRCGVRGIEIYIALRRSRDCQVSFGYVGGFDSQLQASFSYFGQLLHCAPCTS